MTDPNKLEEQKQFAYELNMLTDKARRLNLLRTMHRLHDAIRELGWDMAGQEMPESERNRMYCEVGRL